MAIKADDVEVDWETLEDQQRYLAWLRRRTIRQLRAHHRTVFPKGSEFYMKLPTWVPRYYYERRLIYFYIAKNYHLPNPWKREFRKKALAVLTHRHEDETRAADMSIVRELSDFRKFTAQGIANLPEDRVDVYLTRLGYMVDLPLDYKKRILFEYYNLHRGDIVPRHSLTTGKPVRYKIQLGTLRARILKHPDWGWPEFEAEYKSEMPGVTRKSFYDARKKLRAAGANIPILKAGRRRNAVIVKGKLGDYGKAVESITRNSRHKGKDTLRVSKRGKNNKE